MRKYDTFDNKFIYLFYKILLNQRAGQNGLLDAVFVLISSFEISFFIFDKEIGASD
jgi:hypothetical protein